MPIGVAYVEEGLLLREGHSVVLVRADGGRWRLGLDRYDHPLLGRRVRVHGIRAEFDLLEVSRIHPC